MSLTVKHLNSDASFLLSLEPILPELADHLRPQPFTILLDPWITGPSKIFHSKISIATHIHPACISSLSELPAQPDLVVISQHKSDHCNEATLRQLPASGTRTLILAEPAAARVIKSWKYFDADKIRTIERWEDPRVTGKQSVIRIPVPPIVPGGQPGEVTVAFIPQKRDIAGLHAAIGITYRPPPTHEYLYHMKTIAPAMYKPPTPPATPSPPNTQASTVTGTSLAIPESILLSPVTPPISPQSLRSVQSTSTLIPSPNLNSYFPRSTSQGHHPLRRPTTSNGPTAVTTTAITRPLSVIFSPHGISYEHLAPYATSHLVAEAALPLTALLHCMDSVTNPWWFGGNICAGVPAGAAIATRLGARVWISAHDGEKEVRGIATGFLRTRRWRREEVEGALDLPLPLPPPTRGTTTSSKQFGHSRQFSGKSVNSNSSASAISTSILRLGSGDEATISGMGMVWCSTDAHRNAHWENNDSNNNARDREKSTPQNTPRLVPNPSSSIGLKGRKSFRAGLSLRFKSAAAATF